MSVVGIGDAVCRESTFWIPAYAGMTFMRGSSPPPSGGAGSPRPPSSSPRPPRHPRVPLVIPAQAGIQKDPGRDTPGIPLLQPSYCESGHASPAVDRPNAVVACINRPAKNAARAPHAEPLQSSMPARHADAAGREHQPTNNRIPPHPPLPRKREHACGWASMPVPLPGQCLSPYPGKPNPHRSRGHRSARHGSRSPIPVRKPMQNRLSQTQTPLPGRPALLALISYRA